MTIKVLLVDDHAMIRAGFRMLIEKSSDLEVVGEADSGRAAVEAVQTIDCDVVLMDVQMADMDGITATRHLVADSGGTARILIVTTFERDDYLFNALKAGASGFLLKTAPPEELIHAIRVVADGQSLLDPAVTGRVIGHFTNSTIATTRPPELDDLTEREMEVLRYVARGRSNAEIADSLAVGTATVKTHVSSVLNKLGLRNRVEAVIFAYENGLVGPTS